MFNRIRDIFRGIGQSIWLAVFGAIILGLIVLSLTREGSGIAPGELQVTLDQLSTQSNQEVPTIAARWTQTPVSAALTGSAPTLALLGQQEIRQYAASAYASSEHDTLDGGAVQAAGPPNTEQCSDARSAWSTADPQGAGILTLLYAQPVTPTGIIVHQTYNPGFITQVTFTDLLGEVHIVYIGTPQPLTICPYQLTIPIQDAGYAGAVVTIFVDQTNSPNGWNQIDAVELIGIKY